MYFTCTGIADEICITNYYLQAITAFALKFEHRQKVVTE